MHFSDTLVFGTFGSAPSPPCKRVSLVALLVGLVVASWVGGACGRGGPRQARVRPAPERASGTRAAWGGRSRSIAGWICRTGSGQRIPSRHWDEKRPCNLGAPIA